MTIRWFARAIAVATTALAAACATAPKPTTVAATVGTSLDANPDTAGRASPLLLRVYELSSRVSFESADFVSLFERDKQALGGDLLGSEEWMMAPGETRAWNKKLAPEARFIGITAAYRNIEQAHWRTIVAVRAQATNTLAIRAQALALSASSAAR